MPEGLVATGASGASIVLAGRSASGTARVLISAIPPRAAVRGPVDLLPWALGAVAALALGLGVWLRRSGPGQAGTTPGGYRGRRRRTV